MSSIFSSFIDQINEFIKNRFQLDSTVTSLIVYDLNTDEKRAHYDDLSSNAPLIIAKQVKMAPQAVAHIIIDEFYHPSCIEKKFAAPGFINFIFMDDFYKNYLQDENIITKTNEPKKYNIEFVSTNPTGPIHVGHGRGGIIGDVLVRTLRILGHRITSEFYINDAGNQIQKLGKSVLARCQEILGMTVDFPEDGYHGEYIKDIAQEYIKNCKDSQIPLILEEEYLGNYAKEKLLQKIKDTLQAYRIHYDIWFSEKTLHQDGSIKSCVEKLQNKGFVYEREGSLWLASTQWGDDKDRVVKKSNGEWTYVAADIAYLANKCERGFEKLIMVLGQDHHSYVTRLKSALQALGYKAEMLDIILYQLVTIKENGAQVRLSKRAGKIISLEDIIEEVGSDVARFFYLNRKADAHLDFDIALALEQSDQNPVYYAQYAYVRLASVLRRVAQDPMLMQLKQDNTTYIYDALERRIIRKLSQLQSLLEHIQETYQTHMLSYYVSDIASLVHSFYAGHKIIDVNDLPNTATRINIVHKIHKTLGLCFDILGISKPEQM